MSRPQVADLSPALGAAADELRRAGFTAQALLLERVRTSGFTTSSELLGEAGLAILSVLDATGRRLPASVGEKLRWCLREVEKVWPDIAAHWARGGRAARREIHANDGPGLLRMASRSDTRSLRAVKAIHTFVWAFFAGSIVAIPVLALRREYRAAFIFIGIVFVEVLVLLINRMSCPLTGVAARYTTDRRANFDIYLPEWLARYNKEVFGLLYGAGVLLTVALWAGWLP